LVTRKQAIDLGTAALLVSDIFQQFVPTRVTEIERKAGAHERDQPSDMLQEQFKVLGVVTNAAAKS
jgi:hypothetical protein